LGWIAPREARIVMHDLIGQSVGRYRVLERLGMGGMATVFKAFDPMMDRYVAIKIPREDLTRDPTFRARFTQEARLDARLEHPHILPVHDFGDDAGRFYLVMRFVDGSTLRELIARRSVSLEDAVRLVAEVAEALAYAHRSGVIHRDVKPANVLVDKDGAALLTDFGIAKLMEGTLHLTGTSEALGTPFYMSPEQIRGRTIDNRTDIYSLGVVLYEALTGRCPFVADTPLAVALMHISDPLPLPREIKPDLPEALELVVLKALAKDPAHRYQTADIFAAALRAVPVELMKPAAVERTLSAPIASAPVPPVAPTPSVEAPEPPILVSPVSPRTPIPAEPPAPVPAAAAAQPLAAGESPSSADAPAPLTWVEPIPVVATPSPPAPVVVAPPADTPPSAATFATASIDLRSIASSPDVEAPVTPVSTGPASSASTFGAAASVATPTLDTPATRAPLEAPVVAPAPTVVPSAETPATPAPSDQAPAEAIAIESAPTSVTTADGPIMTAATRAPGTAASTKSGSIVSATTVEAVRSPESARQEPPILEPTASTPPKTTPKPDVPDDVPRTAATSEAKAGRSPLVYLAAVAAGVVIAVAALLFTRPTSVAPAASGSAPSITTAVSGESNTVTAQLASATPLPTIAPPSPLAVASTPTVDLTATGVATTAAAPDAATPTSANPSTTAPATTVPAAVPTDTPAQPSPTAAPASPTPLPSSPTSEPPTATVVRASPTAPPATATPVPSTVAPVLTGSSAKSGAVVLSWSYGGQLGPNQYFDVRIWQNGQPPIINGTQQTSYTIGGSVPAGTYNWTIAVMSKQNGTVQQVSVASQTLQFTWAPAGGGGKSGGGACPPNC
jgi:serine/threonine protein kinase